MPSRDSALAAFEELRRLAAESPRDARAKLAALLDSGDAVLEETLRLANAPGEGRLRQLIANAVKNRHDKARVVPHLVRWLELETDEFAKAAISGALGDVERAAYQPAATPDPPRLVDTYRYVADRICHRVRNSLTGPAQHLRKLESLLNGGVDPVAVEAKATVSQLKDALRALSRIVEFDIEDSYFQWRSVDLPAWIRTMTAQYIAKNSLLNLSIKGDSASMRVRANDYLLETLFWNLWKNAQQFIDAMDQGYRKEWLAEGVANERGTENIEANANAIVLCFRMWQHREASRFNMGQFPSSRKSERTLDYRKG